MIERVLQKRARSSKQTRGRSKNPKVPINPALGKQFQLFGFGWKDGQFQRCYDPSHYMTSFSVSKKGKKRKPRVVLYDRAPKREVNPRQMQCSLEGKFHELSYYNRMKVAMVRVDFRSSCMEATLSLFLEASNIQMTSKVPLLVSLNIAGVKFYARYKKVYMVEKGAYRYKYFHFYNEFFPRVNYIRRDPEEEYYRKSSRDNTMRIMAQMSNYSRPNRSLQDNGSTNKTVNSNDTPNENQSPSNGLEHEAAAGISENSNQATSKVQDRSLRRRGGSKRSARSSASRRNAARRDAANANALRNAMSMHHSMNQNRNQNRNPISLTSMLAGQNNFRKQDDYRNRQQNNQNMFQRNNLNSHPSSPLSSLFGNRNNMMQHHPNNNLMQNNQNRQNKPSVYGNVDLNISGRDIVERYYRTGRSRSRPRPQLYSRSKLPPDGPPLKLRKSKVNLPWKMTGVNFNVMPREMKGTGFFDYQSILNLWKAPDTINCKHDKSNTEELRGNRYYWRGDDNYESNNRRDDRDRDSRNDRNRGYGNDRNRDWRNDRKLYMSNNNRQGSNYNQNNRENYGGNSSRNESSQFRKVKFSIKKVNYSMDCNVA